MIAIGNYTGACKGRLELWKVSWSLIQLASDVPPDIDICLARQVLVKAWIQSAYIALGLESRAMGTTPPRLTLTARHSL